ncbi:hypothetical protein M0804_013577 [Polistes exclamans]|nr:hypothetical protein M0804_013577 [Polistes exclamans]
MTTKKISITSGIRQSLFCVDSQSLILFNLTVDKMIKEVKTAGEGIKLGKEKKKNNMLRRRCSHHVGRRGRLVKYAVQI